MRHVTSNNSNHSADWISFKKNADWTSPTWPEELANEGDQALNRSA